MLPLLAIPTNTDCSTAHYLGRASMLCVSAREPNACCHCCHFMQASIAALQVTTFGRNTSNLCQQTKYLLPLPGIACSTGSGDIWS
jgi:hypothetical protein